MTDRSQRCALLWLLAALVLTLCLHPRRAEAAVVLDDTRATHNATPLFRFLEDPQERLSFSDVEAQRDSARWQSLSPNQTSLGARTGQVWLCLEAETLTKSPWYLVFSFARFDEIDAWVRYDSGPWAQFQMGIRTPVRQWPTLSHLPAIPLDGSRGRQIKLLLRIRSSTPLSIAAQFQNSAEFHHHLSWSRLILAAFTSLMGAIALFGVVIGFSLFKPSMILFVVQTVAQTAYVWAIDLFDLRLLWPDSPGLALASKNISGFVSSFCLALLVRSIGHTRKWPLHLLTASLCFSVTLAIFSWFFSGSQLDVLAGFAGIFLIVAILASLVTQVGTSRLARYFLGGFSFHLIISAIHMQQIFGVVPATSFTPWLPYLGATGVGFGLLLGFVHDIGGINRKLANTNLALEQKNGELSHLNTVLAGEVEQKKQALSELAAEKQRSIEKARVLTLGEMSRNIAHEINTPLSILSMKIENVSRAIQENPPDIAGARTILGTMAFVVKRATSLVQAMRLLARDGQKETPTTFSLAELIDKVFMLSQERTLHSHIEFTSALSHPEVRLNGREGALFQLLSNLINNAIDALNSEERQGKRIEIHSCVKGEFLVILVSDNGPGVGSGYESNIFEPFFTTKPGSSGMGMGLGIAQSVAREHGGDLLLESPRAPTTIAWTFPLAKVSHLKGRS